MCVCVCWIHIYLYLFLFLVYNRSVEKKLHYQVSDRGCWSYASDVWEGAVRRMIDHFSKRCIDLLAVKIAAARRSDRTHLMRTRLLTQLSHAGAKESYPASPSMAPSHLQLATGYTCAARQFLSSYRSTSCRWWSRYGDRRRAMASGGFPGAAGSVDTGHRRNDEAQ